MIENNYTLERFGVYYIPRKILEEDVSKSIKIVKRKIKKNKRNSIGTDQLEEELKLLTSKRPCVIIKLYKGNVTVLPMTKSGPEVDESHIMTNVFQRKNYSSFIKTSVIQTMSIQKFKKDGDISKKKIPKEEREYLLEILQKHYLI